jgi:hypothetical protein
VQPEGAAVHRCNTVQHSATQCWPDCNTVQHGATWCNLVTTWCNLVATWCNHSATPECNLVVQRFAPGATWCNLVTTWCNTVWCNTVQPGTAQFWHGATRCNTSCGTVQHGATGATQLLTRYWPVQPEHMNTVQLVQPGLQHSATQCNLIATQCNPQCNTVQRSY